MTPNHQNVVARFGRALTNQEAPCFESWPDADACRPVKRLPRALVLSGEQKPSKPGNPPGLCRMASQSSRVMPRTSHGASAAVAMEEQFMMSAIHSFIHSLHSFTKRQRPITLHDSLHSLKAIETCVVFVIVCCRSRLPSRCQPHTHTHTTRHARRTPNEAHDTTTHKNMNVIVMVATSSSSGLHSSALLLRRPTSRHRRHVDWTCACACACSLPHQHGPTTLGCVLAVFKYIFSRMGKLSVSLVFVDGDVAAADSDRPSSLCASVHKSANPIRFPICHNQPNLTGWWLVSCVCTGCADPNWEEGLLGPVGLSARVEAAGPIPHFRSSPPVSLERREGWWWW